ncbi:unnamed protein product [Prunus armeniaca]
MSPPPFLATCVVQADPTGIPHHMYQNKAIMAKASADIFIGKFVAILESEAAFIAAVRDQVDDRD